MSYWDQPATLEFTEGMLFGMCAMAVPAIMLAWSTVRAGKMSRLTDKLAAAAAVAPRQAAKIEARADRIIAMEPEIERMSDDSFGPHEAILDEAQHSLDSLKHELAGFANAPLSVSGDSSPASQQSGSAASTEPGH